MICCVYRRGRFYWGKLQLQHEAKVSRMSLGTTDRRIAQASLLQIAKEREMEHAGLLSPSSVREAATKPLAELVEAFLADLQVKGRSIGTLDKYRSNLSSCAAACRWQTLRDLTARSFCEWRSHSGLSRKTVNDTLAVLCTFCRWLVYQRHLADNPLAHIQRVDTRGMGGQFRRSVSTAELAALLAAAPAARRVVYLTAAHTGLRRKELASLRWADVVLDSAFVRVRASTAKNRRDAVLPLHPELVAALREYRPPHAAPFTPVFKFVPRISTFRRDLVAAGIAFLDGDGRRVDLHSLRVTYGTNLTLSGAAPRVVMELMRHSDIKLTMKIYTDVGRLPLADAVAKLPSLGAQAVCPETCPKTCPDAGLGQSGAVAS